MPGLTLLFLLILSCGMAMASIPPSPPPSPQQAVAIVDEDADQSANITVNWSQANAGSSKPWLCELTFKGSRFLCALGANGVTENKKEGDGCTPAGQFQLRQGFFRQDRTTVEVPAFFNMTVTQPNFGWCDDPTNPLYNEFVFLPFSASHEDLWLQSHDYDVMAVIGYNDDPVVPYQGSAIFFHVSPAYGPTAGCVALLEADLKWVLAQITPSTWMNINILNSP